MKAERDTPNNAVSTGRAQDLFLETLTRLEPRVLETLHDEPLHIYQRTRASVEGYDWATLKEWTQPSDPEEPDLVEIRRAVEAWATPWNLLDPWVLTAACRTLEAWRKGSGVMVFHRGGFGFGTATPLWIRMEFPNQIAEHFQEFVGWEPTYETATEFRGRFMALCEQLVDEHIVTQEKIADEREYGKWLDKRELEQHLEWLVRYQVQRWEKYQIEKEYHRGKDTVRDGLEGVATLIGVTLRPGKRGRPRKSVGIAT